MEKRKTNKYKGLLMLAILLMTAPSTKVMAEGPQVYELPVIMLESEITVDPDDYEDAEISTKNLMPVLQLEREPAEWRVRENRFILTERPSYDLKFRIQVDLLGMGEDRKWVLMSNEEDETMATEKPENFDETIC